MLYYYIMVDPDKKNRCKLGITKNPAQRLKAYRTSNPDCYFLQTYVLPDKKHERQILDLFADVCMVRSEYVHCNPDLAQTIIEGYFSDNDISIDGCD